MSPPSLPGAFFLSRGGGRYESTPATVGPWSPTLQHGSPPIALLARSLEQLAGPPGMRIARLSVEFLSAVPLGELEIEASVSRPGKRIELLEGTARMGERTLLRATAWRLLAEPGRTPQVGPAWHAPPPLPPEQPQAFFPNLDHFGYGSALEWRFVSGRFAELGPSTVYTRTRIPLIEDEPLTGFTRLLLMLDSANGISAELEPAEWLFVPVDLNVVLERHPEGEWVGMEAQTRIGPDGIGMSETRIFDTRGYLGRSLHTLFVSKR